VMQSFMGSMGLALLLEDNINGAKQDAGKKYVITVQQVYMGLLSVPPPEPPHVTETDAAHVARVIEDARMSSNCDIHHIQRSAMNRIMSEGVPMNLDIRWNSMMPYDKTYLTKWHIVGISGGEGPSGIP